MDNYTICVIGLGYVGLPLAVLFGKRFNVTGFDINPHRIEELKKGYDRTGEVSSEELRSVSLTFTTDPEKISDAEVIIITVPTPIDEHKMPDLGPLKLAAETVKKHIISAN